MAPQHSPNLAEAQDNSPPADPRPPKQSKSIGGITRPITKVGLFEQVVSVLRYPIWGGYVQDDV